MLELRLGRSEQAIAAARAALRSGGASPEALAELARQLTEGGRAGAAIELLRPLSGRRDLEATAAKNALCLAYWAAGRRQEARLEAQSVLAIDARNAEAEENLSLADLSLALWSEARDSARQAVALDPRRGNAWNNLGVALDHLGQPAAALDAWQRAVEVDPRQYDTLYNIGVKAVELGRFDLATRALAQFVATAPAERFAADLPASRELLHRLRARRQRAPSR
jgi:Tfp pilus assembly protein PilF